MAGVWAGWRGCDGSDRRCVQYGPTGRTDGEPMVHCTSGQTKRSQTFSAGGDGDVAVRAESSVASCDLEVAAEALSS